MNKINVYHYCAEIYCQGSRGKKQTLSITEGFHYANAPDNFKDIVNSRDLLAQHLLANVPEQDKQPQVFFHSYSFLHQIETENTDA